jgi:breast cancer 2 susceptibility protein
VWLQLIANFLAQVGFSNLVKRQKDETRQVWVAEATESSSYTLSNEIPRKSHLKEAAVLAERWASRSYHVSFPLLTTTC